MAQAPSPPATPGADPGGDPSMEDILASIRRILSEEEQGGETQVPEAPGDDAPPHDILMLNEDMMVPDPAPDLLPEPTPQPMPGPVRDVAPNAVPEPAPPRAPSPAQPAQLLVAPEAAQAAASSLGALARTLAQERGTAVRTSGPTIEDLVREEMRPLLKAWLDAHLPPLVERVVRQEIERVAGRAAP